MAVIFKDTCDTKYCFQHLKNETDASCYNFQLKLHFVKSMFDA